MATWNPGPNPFPNSEILEITRFEYLDELKFVRHARVHIDKVPKSRWQLSADFRVRMKLHPENAKPYLARLRIPRGLVTDLASVPETLWSIVGPIGDHLEACIVHDYLYMAWTDFRTKPIRRDWDFADTVLKAGMESSSVGTLDQTLIYTAVRSVGWSTFRKRRYTLEERMAEWLPLLKKHSRSL